MVVARAGYVLPGPLFGLLERLKHEHGELEDVAAVVGVSARQLQRWLNSGDLPTVTGADRVITNAGASWAELYGEIPPVPADVGGGRCSRCRIELRTSAELCGFCEEEETAARASSDEYLRDWERSRDE